MVSSLEPLPSRKRCSRWRVGDEVFLSTKRLRSCLWPPAPNFHLVFGTISVYFCFTKARDGIMFLFSSSDFSRLTGKKIFFPIHVLQLCKQCCITFFTIFRHFFHDVGVETISHGRLTTVASLKKSRHRR
jgi:hypothetical protein